MIMTLMISLIITLAFSISFPRKLYTDCIKNSLKLLSLKTRFFNIELLVIADYLRLLLTSPHISAIILLQSINFSIDDTIFNNIFSITNVNKIFNGVTAAMPPLVTATFKSFVDS